MNQQVELIQIHRHLLSMDLFSTQFEAIRYKGVGMVFVDEKVGEEVIDKIVEYCDPLGFGVYSCPDPSTCSIPDPNIN